MNRLCSSCTLTLTARAMWFHIVTGVLESEDRLLFVPVLPQNQCSLSYDGSLISLVGMLQVFVRLMTQISCGLADSSLEIALIGFTFDRHLAATYAATADASKILVAQRRLQQLVLANVMVNDCRY